MDTELQNLLYRRPELYESTVQYGADQVSARMCMRFFTQYLDRYPANLLDIGCGTGRDLATLAASCPDCIGVDCQESMIDYARQQRPSIDFRVGDMTSLRLGRRFEAITCLGYAIANVHTNGDLSRAFATFAAHASRGTLLVIDAISAFAAGGGSLPRRFVIDTAGFKATSEARYEDDRRHQLVVRRRRWTVNGGDTIDDYARFRTLAPMELEHYLWLHGFETLAIYDNRELVETDLRGTNLFACARYVGES